MRKLTLAASALLIAIVSAVLFVLAPLASAADSDPWAQQGTALSGSNQGAVALSGDGNVVAVGSPYEDTGGSDAGAVRVYTWSSGWSQRGSSISGAAARDLAGMAVALSDNGSTLVVGAPGDFNSMGGSGRFGSVRIYDWDALSSSWVQRGAVLSGSVNSDGFGQAVALSDDGTMVAVGSPGFDGAGGGYYTGRTSIYQWTSGAWALSRTIDGVSGGGTDDVGSGWALSLNGAGTRIAVGTYDYDGRARVFEVSSGAQVGATLTGTSGWGLGKAVSLDDTGGVLAVGAAGYDSQRGMTRVYALSGSTWTQRGADLLGERTGDRYGESLALSGDGLSVAIGGPDNDEAAASAGHTRVFRWSSTWTQRGGDIDGLASQDAAGSSVAIDDEGVRVATNLSYANSYAGQVRVYAQAGAPGRPTSVTGTPGIGSVIVSWSQPTSDGGYTITQYTATASNAATCSVTSVSPATPATSCTISGLTNGTPYTFTVTATNSAGTGSASTASAAVTPRTTPGQPTGVVGTPGNGSVAISWTAPASNGGASITGYTATAGTGETCTTSTTSCTISGLTNGTSYTFAVTATNSAGTGSASTASAAVTPTTVPGAPTIVVGTPGNGSVTISWMAPASNGGASITSYTATTGTDETCTTSTTSCTISGLTNGASYRFTVTATNAAGTGSASAPSAAVTPAAPVVIVAPEEGGGGSAAKPVAITKATATAARTGGNVTLAVRIPTASIGAQVVIMRKVGNRYVVVSTTKAKSGALTIALKVKGKPGTTQLRVVVRGKVVASLTV